MVLIEEISRNMKSQQGVCRWHTDFPVPEICYHDPDAIIWNMLDNPDFKGQFDYVPYIELDKSGKPDESTEGAMYCPVIVGSDKTTVSVATGQVEYHPVYFSIGGVHNTLRRAHHGAVAPGAFLAIPKAAHKYDKDPEFHRFKRQLYHASLAAVLKSLHPGMTTPVITLNKFSWQVSFRVGVKGQPPEHPVRTTGPIGVMGVNMCNPKMIVTPTLI
ncbi:uncharacterized protein LACBIDRAFT_322804 [Laccaria bicolor S238N-H82]|uniref:Predicted protein n=1 Tax=Laccaria bicolor (strain S238N-H82 / ATCC MYA-4686) TaxID=486041 RepID=B0CV52_LACBS|nr:uncharacterized protein LACBIDRAFT_322804 [Laccaria bicolor S238N-H82]EDR13269.1 predicted protein [Laccaria bicolor S238N-H82]|eukprot:XP_001875767.1 predicted protein [Laccaria bicolor S238N-H82]